MHLIKILIAITSLFIANVIYAANNDCTQFGIQVLNKTDSECIMTSYKMIKGYLISVTPNTSVISANASQTFITEQNLAQGPTITIDYMCNGRKIRLESHQNFCMMEAGSIQGYVISADPGISAIYTSTIGSYFWSYLGHLYWAIESK